MKIATDDRQTILRRERGHPDIVLGNGVAAPAKVFADIRIMKSCFHVDRKNDRFLDQEVEEPSETTAMTRSYQSVPVLTDYDHRKMVLFFSGEDFSNGRVAGERGLTPVCIEDQRHSEEST